MRASALPGEADAATVVQTLLESAARLVQADSSACALLGPGGEIGEVVHYPPPETVPHVGGPGGGSAVAALVLGCESPVLCIDDLRGHEMAGAITAAGPSIQSLLGVPIRLREELIGVLYLTREPGKPPFDQRAAEEIRELANAAGAAIANARSLEAGRRRERWLETLASIATSLLSGRALADVLPAVVRQAREVVDADGAAVAIPDDTGDFVVVRHAEGLGSEYLENAEFPADSTFVGSALRRRTTIEVEELASDPRVTFRPGLIDNVGPAVYVPLGTPTSARGVLFVYKRLGAAPFDRHAVAMLKAFATQAAVALELAERRQDTTRLALLEDRERIARDLHDVVIQRLFAIGLILDGASHSIMNAEAGQRIMRAVDDLDETIREIRTTIFGLQAPAGPEYSSLRARVVGIVDQAIQALGFVPSLRFEGLIDTVVPAALSDQVVAVLREALSNAARHARAAEVEIKLTVTADDLSLRVDDDGVGIPKGGRRSGLRNLQARAAAHGGRLVVEPRVPSGTHLEWTVPLRGSVADGGRV